MNLLEMIFFLCSGQGLFLSFLLLKQKKIKNRDWLSLYFAAYSLILINWVMFWHDDLSVPVRHILFYIPAQSLLGVALFLFLQKDTRILNVLAHLAIPIISTAWSLPIWLYHLGFIKLPEWYIANYWGHLPYLTQITCFTIAGYGFVVWKKVKNSVEKKLLFGLIAYFIGFETYSVVSRMGLMTDWIDYVVSGVITVSFYFNGYHYLVAQNSRTKKNISVVAGNPSPSKIQAIHLHLLETNVFLNPNFKLEDLARSMQLPIATISSAITESQYANFPEMINAYRIGHAKKLLTERDSKILAIALDSGYNNKVSFIQNFKKVCHMTPTEFRKQYSTELVS